MISKLINWWTRKDRKISELKMSNEKLKSDIVRAANKYVSTKKDLNIRIAALEKTNDIYKSRLDKKLGI